MAEDNEKIEQDEEKWKYGTIMFDRIFGHWFEAGKVVKDSFEKKPLPESEPKIKSDTMLNEGEEVLLVANQKRIVPGGSLATPDSIYVTNRRVISRNPRWLGMKKDIIDFMYRDLANVELHEGVWSSEIELTPRFNSEKVKLPAIAKDVAKKLFHMIRRGLNGEFGFGYGVAGIDGQISVQSQPPQKPDDAITKLERVTKLREKGMISEEEFQQLRAKFLEEM